MGFLTLAIIATIIVTFMSKERWTDGRTVNLGALIGTFLKFGVLFLALGIALTIATTSVVVVPPGYRGIVFNKFSGVRQQPLNEGFNFIMPIVEQAYFMDTRVQKDTYDASAASKDLQVVHTKVALNFHPNADAVPRIFQQVGAGYSERIIQPAVQEAVKATTARFTAEELVTRREDVKKVIREHVEKQISPFNIRLDDLYITDFDFSKQFAEAIESKQIAEQQALKARRDLDRVKIEAEQKIATARAEAESLRMQKEAITPQLIELRKVETQKIAIERWDGKMPSVIMGNGATPLLDLSTIAPKR